MVFEQTFNRLYANSLAREIANSDPRFVEYSISGMVQDIGQSLEKNEDLKSVALMETPWVRQAKSESEARRNVGILFDDDRLNDEKRRTFEKLKQMQLSDGAAMVPGRQGE